MDFKNTLYQNIQLVFSDSCQEPAAWKAMDEIVVTVKGYSNLAIHLPLKPLVEDVQKGFSLTDSCSLRSKSEFASRPTHYEGCKWLQFKSTALLLEKQLFYPSICLLFNPEMNEEGAWKIIDDLPLRLKELEERVKLSHPNMLPQLEELKKVFAKTNDCNLRSKTDFNNRMSSHYSSCHWKELLSLAQNFATM
eukprot:TRINITY_DN15012_c0_g1_i1.p1 TRINITY_DN15012_c0_g1~~TRINITY_DN15012_c0_g1_i1.p1  ORF type:complete len:193 (+),score=50.92 TRINITY_DN15012_c0_g1_i1:31-609(+)